MTNDLPAGWIKARLGDVCLPVGKTDPRNQPEHGFDYIDIGGVQPGTGRIQETKWLLGADAPSRARQKVRAGDVVLSTVRTYQRKTAIVTPDLDGAIASTGFAVLRPPPEIDPRFLLFQALGHEFVQQLNERQTGTSYPAVRDRDVREVSVKIAPPAEQERIVAALEEHFSRLDAAEEDITRGRGRSATLPSVALPGLFSADWPTRRIGELAHVGSGATPKRSDVRYWSGGTIPWITSGAINERMITSASELITEEALAETSVRLWPVGTVLVAMYGEGKTRGKAALLQIQSTCNQACAAIDYDRSLITGEYLLACLNSRYEASRRLASGGVQPNLSLGLIKGMEIPVPSLETQRSVALQAEDIVLGSERLSATCTMAHRHVTALRRSILAAAFSGALVPQDLNDEPASVMLERIEASRPAKQRRKVGA